MPVIKFELVRHDGIVHPIPDIGVTIGRSRGNDIYLPEDDISRIHARVFIINGVCWIQDEGSKSGVLVNNHKIQGRLALNVNDIIQIGRYNFRLVKGGEQAQGKTGQDNKRTIAVIASAAVVIIFAVALIFGGGSNNLGGGGGGGGDGNTNSGIQGQVADVTSTQSGVVSTNNPTPYPTVTSPVTERGSLEPVYKQVEYVLENNQIPELFAELSPELRGVFTLNSLIDSEEQVKNEKGEILKITIVEPLTIRNEVGWDGEWAEATLRIRRTAGEETFLVRFQLVDGEWWLYGTLQIAP